MTVQVHDSNFLASFLSLCGTYHAAANGVESMETCSKATVMNDFSNHILDEGFQMK